MRNRISQMASDAARLVYARLFDESHARALSLRDSIFRLAREFEIANNRPPHDGELWQELNQRMGKDGRISYIFNSSASPEKKYSDIYRALTLETVPQVKSDKHKRVYGDASEVEASLYQTQTHNVTSLIEKLDSHLGNYQIASAEKIIDYARKNLPRADRRQLNAQLRGALAKRHFQALAFVENCDHSKAQISIRRQFDKFALDCGLDVNCIFGIFDYFPSDNPPFKTDTFLKIREFLSYEIDDIADLNQRSSAMSTLFPAYRDFIKYCENWPSYQDGYLFLKTNADVNLWNKAHELDYASEWGEALLQYGPQILYYFELGNDNEPLPRNKDGSVSLKSLKEQVYDALLWREPVDPEFADLHRFCFDHQLSICDDYEGAKYLIEEYGGKERDGDFIPPVEIEGHRFGLPGYNFRLLEDDDFRVFFPGRFTNCCERLFKHCQTSVIHAYKTKESGFFVVTDPQDRIIAHSWAWRSRENILMFDGFEARETDKRINNGVLKNLLSAVSQELSRPEYAFYNIPAIALGHSGKSLKPHEGLPLLEFDQSHMIMMDWASEDDEEVFGPINEQDIGFSDSFYIVEDYRYDYPVQTFGQDLAP